jgi:hypothetical protein
LNVGDAATRDFDALSLPSIAYGGIAILKGCCEAAFWLSCESFACAEGGCCELLDSEESDCSVLLDDAGLVDLFEPSAAARLCWVSRCCCCWLSSSSGINAKVPLLFGCSGGSTEYIANMRMQDILAISNMKETRVRRHRVAHLKK